jgi:rhodanese-related sulfurtransferase
MKRYTELIKECRQIVKEIMPWDLEELLEEEQKPLLLDVREGDEYVAMHIENSLHVPRGILETSCEYGFEETVPELVEARQREVIVVCRSGNRSLFAAKVMQELGYLNVLSLKTGLKGWNDCELPLLDQTNKLVDMEAADDFFETKVRPDQLKPSG